MINLYKQAAVATTLLLSLFLLPACSGDEGGGPDIPDSKYAKLTISLSSMDNSAPTQTKAAITDGDDSGYEHFISDYRIIILQKGADDTYKVSHNISGNDANNGNPNSETTKEVELEIGQTYKFYAFANLDGLANGGDYIKNLAIDAELDLSHAVELKTMDEYTGSTYIPMSSYGTAVTVAESNNPVSLQLIRLVGKVSLSIDNGTEGELKIRKVQLGQFRTGGPVYLLPYDAAKGEATKLLEATGNMDETYAPSFPGELTDGTITGTFAEKKLLSADLTLQEGVTYFFPAFYANETRFTAVNSGKPLMITTDIDGRNAEPKPTTFNFIRRNDWLQIPILISNAETTISIDQQHMPIGAIPASYKFKSGVVVSSMEFETDHGGDITIKYSVKVDGGTNLKYYPGGVIVEGTQYCSAVLESHTNSLLINLPDAASDAGWQPDKIEFEMTPEGDATNSLAGSFKVTAQELSYSASATIKLTLVVSGTKGSDPMEIVLPYTITITNGKLEKTDDGGN